MSKINKCLAKLMQQNEKTQINEIRDVKILQHSPMEFRGLEGHIFKALEVGNSQRNVWASLHIWHMKVKPRGENI